MTFEKSMQAALEAARRFEGATAPNPPVGAAITDSSGEILAVGAHEKAGAAHAEIAAIRNAQASGTWARRDTLLVTLEPCNHTGRTPPCSDAILEAGFRRVVIGTRDPNPGVRGGGIEKLRHAGVEVVVGVLEPECKELIRSFTKWSMTGIPWITVKTAWNLDGSMTPEPGQKTFTSRSSLELAHRLRRRADAILTGSGTVLADQPEFTVRHVEDHPGKQRWLIVLDRRGRVPASWVQAAQARGFTVRTDLELEEALVFLGAQGCLELLVEAGPALSAEVLGRNQWDEHLMIRKRPEGQPDEVVIHRRNQ